MKCGLAAHTLALQLNLPDAVEERRLCSEQHRVHSHDEGERVLQQYGESAH